VKPAPALGRFHWATILGTWFGAGLLPKAPGTWGSLAALPFAWVIATLAGPLWLLPAALILFCLGWAASSAIVTRSRVQDPQAIVVDEVVGVWLTLAFVPPHVLIYAIGFLAFRLADITKPFPAGWADRHIHGGLGVMLDDVLAAIYSALATALIAWVI
jgi:phosphatidylglycerophosphatase A